MFANLNLKKSSYQLLVMSVIGVIILIGQRISVGTSIVTALPGMVMLILAAMAAMIIKDLFPKSIFPAFGFATIIGLLLSMPYSPTSEVFLTNTNNINFMAITTPLLAFAGISVGNKIEALKVFQEAGLSFIKIVYGCPYSEKKEIIASDEELQKKVIEL